VRATDNPSPTCISDLKRTLGFGHDLGSRPRRRAAQATKRYCAELGPMTGIGGRMATGAVWMVLAKVVERSLGLVSTLVLARLLVPHDFGIVAMAMSFVALLELLSAFGFDVALIQRQTTERHYWDTAWTFEVIIGSIIACAMVVGAPLAADFFNEPALTDVLRVLAIGSFAQGFQNVGLVAFRTEMRFDREFRFLAAKKVIAFAVTIAAVLILHSFWALVIGQTASRIAGTALSYWVHPYRPRFSLQGRHALLHFSKWILAINLISYLKERSSDLVIGRVAGPTALGTFSVAYELSSLPSTELMAPINRAVFPAYAKVAAENRSALPREYLSVISMIALLAIPAVLGVAAISPLLIPVALGPNWTQAVPVVVILAFFGLTNIVQSNAQAAYLALGRADVPAKLNALHVAVQLAAVIPLTLRYGVVGSATGYLATATIMIPLSLGVVLRMLEIRAVAFIAHIWRPIAAASAMFVAVRGYLLVAAPSSAAASVLQLLVGVGVGVTAYVAGITVLWWACGAPKTAERAALDKLSAVATLVVSLFVRQLSSSRSARSP
jgi:O-antigen/teichoic acid export membrane protein